MAASRDSVVVLSANEARLPYVRRLWQRDGRPDLVGAERPSDLRAMVPRGLHVAGIILDLARPADWRGEPFTWSYEAWDLSAIVAAVLQCEAAPVLVVSTFDPMEAALRDAGVRVVAQLGPEADDAAWLDALGQLAVAALELAERGDRGTGVPPMEPPPRAIVLRSGLWLDLEDGVVWREGQPWQLTASEVEVLRALTQAHDHYLSAATLAQRLTHPDASYPVAEHSVEQLIYSLRRKLGDSGRHPAILVNRRRMGYALVLLHPAPTPPRATSTSPAAKAERNLKLF